MFGRCDTPRSATPSRRGEKLCTARILNTCLLTWGYLRVVRSFPHVVHTGYPIGPAWQGNPSTPCPGVVHNRDWRSNSDRSTVPEAGDRQPVVVSREGIHRLLSVSKVGLRPTVGAPR